MQSVKSFLALGTEDQYKKMNREAFLFRLINFFDGTNEECPYPDRDVKKIELFDVKKFH